MGSPRFKLSKEDWIKVGRGALIAGGGAVLVYIADFLQTADFAGWTPVMVAVASVLVNIARKFLTDTE